MTNINIELVKCSNTIVRPNIIKSKDETVFKNIYLFFFNQLLKNLNPGIDVINWENSLIETRKYANVILNNLFNDNILTISDNIKKEDAFNQIISKIERNLQYIICENIQCCNPLMNFSFKEILLDKDFIQLDDENVCTLNRLQKLKIDWKQLLIIIINGIKY